MSAAVCYFLVYFAEALILLQYSSNVFEYKISSIKRYILLTVLFIPIYFISFAHIGLLNTALFFVATYVFLKISTMENSATLFFHSAVMIVIMTLCELASMGHPLGATGAILINTLLDELERRDLTTGLATLCVGGGMGIATIIERV